MLWFDENAWNQLGNFYMARAEFDPSLRQRHLREMMKRIESQEEIGFVKSKFLSKLLSRN